MGRDGVRVVAALTVVAAVAAGCSSGRPAKQAAPPPAPPGPTTTAAAAVPSPAPPTTAAARPRPRGTALARFSSCASLLRQVKAEALAKVGAYGLEGVAYPVHGVAVAAAGDGARTRAEQGSVASSGASGSSYSGTNVQEAGVDEPDLVKTDGRLLVTVVRERLQVVDLRPSRPAVVATLSLPGDGYGGGELLLAGNRVVVLQQQMPGTRVTVVDVGDPARPAVVATMTMEGQYVSARLVSGVARLVLTARASSLQWAAAAGTGDEARAREANRQVIVRSTVDDWLPNYTLERPGRAPVRGLLAPCTSVLRPKQLENLTTVSVVTVDPADPGPADPGCVLGAGEVVYASPSNLYVASSGPWSGWRAGTATAATTEIHQFAIDGRQPAWYAATGVVPGGVLNQFSMSEHGGRLRVATTSLATAGEQQHSRVLVLEPKDGKLVTVGQVGGLGKGEQIHAVRFIGTKGYVVTFRQVDPLYVVDLADPRNPRVTGELKIPGYSAYLHPVSDTLLLGVGVDATEDGRRLGNQLSLFDVSNPAKPVRRYQKSFPGSYSEAEHDHHAFLWWPATGLSVIPVVNWEGEHFVGAVATPLDPRRGFGDPVRLTHAGRATAPPAAGQEMAGDAAIRRSLVVGQGLLTLSDHGLLVSDLATLADRSWVAFS